MVGNFYALVLKRKTRLKKYSVSLALGELGEKKKKKREIVCFVLPGIILCLFCKKKKK